MDIVNEIKNSFKKGTYLTQLIYVNLAIFVLVNLISVFYFIIGQPAFQSPFLGWFALPAEPSQILWKPWSILSYMFLHEGFLHVVFNILWLYWFGKIFLQYLNQKQLLSVYILGGISGGLLYIMAYNLLPVFASELPIATLMGASAAVMAIVFAISFYVPDYKVHLFFVGKIPLKYIAYAIFILDIIKIPNGNAGGQIAHIGGALFGYYFIMQYKKGKSITKGFEKILDQFFSLFKSKRGKMKVTHKKTGNVDYDYNNKKSGQQETMNKILEKISKSGYSSLSKEEKEILFKMSDKNKLN